MLSAVKLNKVGTLKSGNTLWREKKGKTAEIEFLYQLAAQLGFYMLNPGDIDGMHVYSRGALSSI